MTLPRISFGIIVLNGSAYLPYNLRSLYPFAHQIIVVEGASPAAKAIATPDGHSTDNTLQLLHDFKMQEDPEGKIIIVTAEDEGHPDGFWPGEKDEQSQAYASRATGDYLWQVDMDEFYKEEDMLFILQMLKIDPTITAVSFKILTFWGGFDYITDGWYLREGAEIYHRLFKWEPGYQYITHRPPTVHDDEGRDLRMLNWVRGEQLAQQGVLLYHYSVLLPDQVREKAEYYAAGPWGNYAKGIVQWAQENFLTPIQRPFQIHNMHTHPSWIKRFYDRHPEQIECMKEDIKSGALAIPYRDNQDVEKLLSLPSYRFWSRLFEMLSFIVKRHRFYPKKYLHRMVLKITYDHETNRLGLG